MNLTDYPVVLTVKEVAKIMRISPNKVYELVRLKDKQFPSIREGSRIMIPRDAFFKWLDPSYKTEQQHQPIQIRESKHLDDPVLSVCKEAIKRAVREGRLTIDEVVDWGMRR